MQWGEKIAWGEGLIYGDLLTFAIGIGSGITLILHSLIYRKDLLFYIPASAAFIACAIQVARMTNYL